MTTAPANPNPDGPWTYQELADKFKVHVETMKRWLRPYKKFSPTKRSVRLTKPQLEYFIRKSGRQPKK